DGSVEASGFSGLPVSGLLTSGLSASGFSGVPSVGSFTETEGSSGGLLLPCFPPMRFGILHPVSSRNSSTVSSIFFIWVLLSQGMDRERGDAPRQRGGIPFQGTRALHLHRPACSRIAYLMIVMPPIMGT